MLTMKKGIFLPALVLIADVTTIIFAILSFLEKINFNVFLLSFGIMSFLSGLMYFGIKRHQAKTEKERMTYFFIGIASIIAGAVLTVVSIFLIIKE